MAVKLDDVAVKAALAINMAPPWLAVRFRAFPVKVEESMVTLHHVPAYIPPVVAYTIKQDRRGNQHIEGEDQLQLPLPLLRFTTQYHGRYHRLNNNLPTGILLRDIVGEVGGGDG